MLIPFGQRGFQIQVVNDLTAKRILCQKKRNGISLDPLSGILKSCFISLNLSNLAHIDNTRHGVHIQCLELAYEKV